MTVYTPPDQTIGTRWNWFKSELVTFPDGSQEMAHRHPNGAGWVADSCDVAMSVYVHCLACVYGSSIVRGNSELNQFAQIYGGAQVFGNVMLSVSSTGMPSNGYTAIRGPGSVYGDVVMLDDGMKALELQPGGQILSNLMINGTTSDTVPTDFSHINQLNARDFKPGSEVYPIPEEDPEIDQDTEESSNTTPSPPSSVANPEDTCSGEIYAKLLASNDCGHLSNVPNATQEANLRHLCANIILPIQRRCGKVKINSGFRSPAVNTCVNSKATNSQHTKGEAVDLEVFTMDNLALAQWIVKNLEFDQLLLENHIRGTPDSGWVHVSLKKEGVNRKDVRTAYTSPKWTSIVGLKPR